MAESSTLDSFLLENPQLRPDLADVLWQCATEMDRLHRHRLTGRLNPKNIIVDRHSERLLLNFQHIHKVSYTTKRQSEAIRSFGHLARQMAAKTRTRIDPILERLISQLEQSDSLRRPHSFHLVLSDPFFVLNCPEARNRLVRLFDTQLHFRQRLVDPDQLTRFSQSAAIESRRQVRNEDFSVLEQLTRKLAADRDVSDWLTECRRRVPLLSSHWLYHVISPVSFLLTHEEDESGNGTLHQAAKLSSDPEIVRFLVEMGADVSATNHSGWTPLHSAALSNQNAEVVSYLLVRKADPNVQDEDGHTALHAAAARNPNHVVTRLLLEDGADPNLLNKGGSSPLHLAARFNANPSVIRQLLNFGAQVNARGPRGQTPLHLAAKNETKTDDINCGIVALLLEHGAKIDAVDLNGRTILHTVVAEASNAELIEFLLENGADVDSGEKTALQLALERCADGEIVEMLRGAGGISRSDRESNPVRCCTLS